MNIIRYTMIGLFVVSTMGSINSIGKERRPKTSNDAIGELILNTLFVIGILYL